MLPVDVDGRVIYTAEESTEQKIHTFTINCSPTGIKFAPKDKNNPNTAQVLFA
jgi:hypothetical protein